MEHTRHITADAIPREVREVVERLQREGHHAYLVGGGVRDLLRGLEPKDYDVATSARPEQVQALFRRVIPTGIQHGTVTVLSGKWHVEVTTFRSEGAYVDGRRPSRVAFDTDITGDLARRDFTINAIAFDPVKGEQVDPFGGLADLQAGVIRCVGEPSERFGEDGLRPLRAVRFSAVLGFRLDPKTEAAIRPLLGIVAKVSAERVREELDKLLLSPRTQEGLALLERTGLMGVVLPEVAAVRGRMDGEDDLLDRSIAAAAALPAQPELRWAALLHATAGSAAASADVARAVLTRLKFPNRVIDAAVHAVRHRDVEPLRSASDADLRRWMSGVGRDAVSAVLALAAATTPSARRAAVQALADRAQALLASNPPLTARDLALKGSDVMRILGVGPSPAVGEATRYLLDQVLEDPSLNTAAALEHKLTAWRNPGKS